MEDSKIVDLFWERSETAVTQTQEKYRRYCHFIAYNILGSNEDAEECVNDAYVRVWNSIPPHRPEMLSTFIGKITRNLALDRIKSANTQKRSGARSSVIIGELQECIPDLAYPSDIADRIALRDALNSFLYSLPDETMKIFLQRYWYVSSVKEIAEEFSVSQSKVKITLHRTRNALKLYLEKEGIII
ncbi:MAG: RNA polymerase sigma factor [Clostridia bacterium]|nr:RNA polymerase sigma factor [Clostridia bacterium]